jgi:hypothetical protein
MNQTDFGNKAMTWTLLARTAGAVAMAMTAVACGGEAATGGAAHPESGGPSKADPVSPLKLAHYSTPNAVKGFVFDRTGPKPKVRFDGQTDIVELEMEADPKSAGSFFFKGTDGKPWIHVSEGGSVSLLTSGRPETVLRDTDAKPLGEPTKRWTAGAEATAKEAAKDDNDRIREKLTAMSVLSKMAGTKPEDSGNLNAIAKAFETATPDMIVHFASRGAYEFKWMPASNFIGDADHAGGIWGYPTKTPWSKTATGAAKYGAIIVAETSGPSKIPVYRYVDSSAFEDANLLGPGRGHRIRVLEAEGFPQPMAENTPGLVWAVHDGTVVFVSADGGRYQTILYGDTVIKAKGASPFESGPGAVANWPAPLQHSLWNEEALQLAVKGHALPENADASLQNAAKAFRECADKVWDSSKKEATALENDRNATSSKARQLYEKTAQVVRKTCAKHVKEYDDSLTKLVEERDKARKSLFEKFKAKFGK